MKPLHLRNTVLDARSGPRICVSLTGKDEPALRQELQQVLTSPAEILEWRLDYFAQLDDAKAVLSAAKAIRHAAGDLPIILTRRSIREGGQPIPLNEQQVFALYHDIAHSACADVLDWELDSPEEMLDACRALARNTGTKLLASYHNFNHTPESSTLIAKFRTAQASGADIAKLAVMPRSPHDVLALLEACLAADAELQIPVVAMSMGALGANTRLIAWQFGSAITFAAGSQASAPGQWPIAELRQALTLLLTNVGVADNGLRDL